MKYQLITNAHIVNQRRIFKGDVLIQGERIAKVAAYIERKPYYACVDASGLYLMPGMIDAHVHFREPGLTHKGTIESESRAAVAGGITSYMDMPNTIPHATTIAQLEQKYKLAARSSFANYSFYFGLNATNLEEALQVDPSAVCGLTDDGLYFDAEDSLLCNQVEYLDALFSKSKSLIALHCEDEKRIAENERLFRAEYGEAVPARFHACIRSSKACYEATQRVVELARKHNARVHILHVSSEAEVALFDPAADPGHKRITAEVCIHHLYFSAKDYDTKGMLIKWNPSIKDEVDRLGLLRALRDGRIDSIATDHAPHTLGEKQTDYFSSRSGAPSVQQALPVLLELYHRGELSLEEIVEKACHHPARIFQVRERGFIQEGFYADLVLVDLRKRHSIRKADLLYTCGWSPFENETLRGVVDSVWVNGARVLKAGQLTGERNSMRLQFDRQV